MQFIDLAKSRYTTKTYDPNQKISEDDIQQLKEILRLSPSSINSQSWKFFFVSNEKIKRDLANASYWNADRINQASHLVVFSAINNIELFEKQICENLPEGSVDYYKQFLKPKTEAEIKSWLQHQVYLSLGFFLSACASIGIDSTPMEGLKNEQYDKIIGLQDYKTLFAVAIGYRDPRDSNQPLVKPKSRLPLEQIIVSI